jgi:hypothetical protein
MEKKLKLVNNYHNTEAEVRFKKITDGRYTGYYKISLKQARRAKIKLCGNRDCTCGDFMGRRGKIAGDYDYQFNDIDCNNNFIYEIIAK